MLEKDKLLFAFLMTVHLKAHVQHALDWSALRFLLTGACRVAACTDGSAQQMLLWESPLSSKALNQVTHSVI